MCNLPVVAFDSAARVGGLRPAGSDETSSRGGVRSLQAVETARLPTALLEDLGVAADEHLVTESERARQKKDALNPGTLRPR